MFSALPQLTRWLHPQSPNNSSLGRLCPSGAALILYPSVPGERDRSKERPERGPPAPSHPIQLTAQPDGVLETSTSFLLAVVTERVRPQESLSRRPSVVSAPPSPPRPPRGRARRCARPSLRRVSRLRGRSPSGASAALSTLGGAGLTRGLGERAVGGPV